MVYRRKIDEFSSDEDLSDEEIDVKALWRIPSFIKHIERADDVEGSDENPIVLELYPLSYISVEEEEEELLYPSENGQHTPINEIEGSLSSNESLGQLTNQFSTIQQANEDDVSFRNRMRAFFTRFMPTGRDSLLSSADGESSNFADTASLLHGFPPHTVIFADSGIEEESNLFRHQTLWSLYSPSSDGSESYTPPPTARRFIEDEL